MTCQDHWSAYRPETTGSAKGGEKKQRRGLHYYIATSISEGPVKPLNTTKIKPESLDSQLPPTQRHTMIIKSNIFLQYRKQQ